MNKKPIEQHQPMPMEDKTVVIGCLVAGLAVVVMAIVGWI